MVGVLGKKRAVVLLCALAAATLVVLVAVAASKKPAAAATDRLPDLGMAQLQNLRIKNCTQTNFKDCAYVGQKQLRFDTVIVNVGAGSFEARGKRSTTSSSMTVTQRIDNGTKVGAGAKEGFCFFDNVPFGSTQDAFYKGCGNNPDALQVKMGLSRGWGDRYGAGTVGQYIDITNLTSGRYKLQATADEPNWFLESDDSNNFTWVEIQISGNSLSVIAYGPAAQPI